MGMEPIAPLLVEPGIIKLRWAVILLFIFITGLAVNIDLVGGSGKGPLDRRGGASGLVRGRRDGVAGRNRRREEDTDAKRAEAQCTGHDGGCCRWRSRSSNCMCGKKRKRGVQTGGQSYINCRSGVTWEALPSELGGLCCRISSNLFLGAELVSCTE